MRWLVGYVLIHILCVSFYDSFCMHDEIEHDATIRRVAFFVCFICISLYILFCFLFVFSLIISFREFDPIVLVQAVVNAVLTN